jgi:sugar phosphate isomerase/epimerase
MGAGGARILPSPEKYNNVIEQMADICKYAISPVLDEYGIILALEGLRRDETPIMHRTDESVKIAKLANVPNIKVMADLYHVAGEGENLADFANYRGYIRHGHIGKPQPRVMPSEGDGYDYKPFFDALRLANFNGRLSVEAGLSCDDFKTSIERAFAVLEPLL